jgi:membrane-bound ClpP family serine protease
MGASISRVATVAVTLIGCASIALGVRGGLALLNTSLAPPDALQWQVGLTVVLLVAGFSLLVGGLAMNARQKTRRRG